MTAKGHVMLAVSFSTGLFLANDIDLMHPQTHAYLFLIAFGSLFPDIDEKNSYIGRKFTVLALIFQGFGIKHRTITHWLCFPLVAAALCIILLGIQESSYYLAFFFGIFLHTVGDLLTKGGIVGYLWPLFPNTTIRLLPKKYSFYTGGAVEYIIITALLFSEIFLLYTGGFQNA